MLDVCRLARPVNQFPRLAHHPPAPDPGRLARPVNQFADWTSARLPWSDPGRLARPVKEFARPTHELLPRPLSCSSPGSGTGAAAQKCCKTPGIFSVGRGGHRPRRGSRTPGSSVAEWQLPFAINVVL